MKEVKQYNNCRNLKKITGNYTTGFTLIEILVGISIIGILSGVFLVNFSRAREQFAVQRAAHKLAQDLREIQQMALSPTEAICAGNKAVYEFGIYFNQASPASYVLFADCNDNRQYDSGVDKLLNTINFEKKVRICSLSPSLSTSVVFSPPVPKVYINGSSDAFSKAQIILWWQKGSLNCSGSGVKRKVIEVNKTGLIEIK